MKHRNTVFPIILILILAVAAKSIHHPGINIWLQISAIPTFYILAVIIIFRSQKRWTTLLWSAPILIYLIKDLYIFIFGMIFAFVTLFSYKFG